MDRPSPAVWMATVCLFALLVIAIMGMALAIDRWEHSGVEAGIGLFVSAYCFSTLLKVLTKGRQA